MATAGSPPNPLPTYIYKILPPADFKAVLSSSAEGPELTDSTALPSTELDRNDGFIHLSTHEQVRGVLDRFFNGPDQAEIALVRLEYQALAKSTEDKSSAKLQWDQAGAGVFPHVYNADIEGNVVRGWHFVSRGQKWQDALGSLEEKGWFVD